MSIFGGVNRFADRVEARLPRWLRWDFWGDPISWAHHTLWALLITGLFALFGWAQVGAVMALAFYVVREGEALWLARHQPGIFWRGRPHWTGWAIDGFMDCVGPAFVAWWVCG